MNDDPPVNKYNLSLLEACGVILLGWEVKPFREPDRFPYLLVQDPKQFVFSNEVANDPKEE